MNLTKLVGLCGKGKLMVDFTYDIVTEDNLGICFVLK